MSAPTISSEKATTPSDIDRAMQKRTPLFHLRPLFLAALGLCLGTGLFFWLPGRFLLPSGLVCAFLACFRLSRKWNSAAILALCTVLGLARAFLPPLTLPEGISAHFSALAGAFGGRIDALFPDYPGVARGMLLGARNSEIEAALSRRLYDVGVGHLLAVSGLHVSILSGCILLIWRRYALRLRYACIAAFLLFYCLLTGGAPSVIRASVMLLCTIPAGPSLRRRDTLSSLSLACCIVVLLDPAAPATPGFQLSFLAVLGIVLLAPVLQARFSLLAPPLAKSLSATLAATFGTAPVMARAFSQISIFGLCANVLVVPLAPFFLAPALLCTVLSFPFPAFAETLAALPRFVLKLMMTLSLAGGSTVLRVSAPPAAAMLLYYAALLFCSRFCMRPARTRALYAGLCLLPGLLLWALLPAAV